METVISQNIYLKKIDYLEKYLRWIVGQEATESGLILTNEEVRTFASKGIEKGKHNNLKKSIFKTKKADLISIVELPKSIAKWLNNL